VWVRGEFQRMTNTHIIWLTISCALVPTLLQIINSWVLKWHENRKKETPAKEKNEVIGKTQEQKHKPFGFRFYHVLLSWVLISGSIYLISWLLNFPSANKNLDAFNIALNIILIWMNYNVIFIEPFLDKRFERINKNSDAVVSNLKTQNEVNFFFKKQIDELQKKLETRQKKK
jgi:hypothetical protein